MGRNTVWNPEIDHQGTPYTQFNVGFTLQLSKPSYMIVDLNKTAGETNQITYRYGNAAWSGVTNSEYKTSKLVLRRIPATTSGVWRVMSGGTDYFTFGSPTSEVERTASREALVKIKLTQDYWMTVYELTQAQLWCITNGFTHANNEFPSADCTYDKMRGTIAQGINWPSTGYSVAANSVLAVFREKTGLALDLPTEAQWEYACRAGTTTPFNDGVFKANYTTNDYDASMRTLGRFKLNGNAYTSVGQYRPNAWGLYDMHGNAYEFCLDWKLDNINPGNAEYLLNPSGPSYSSGARIVRSGSYNADSKYCRSALRSNNASTAAYGYRLIVPAAD